jgi:uncharacterized protein with ParB-like and HNH nuclease domain
MKASQPDSITKFIKSNELTFEIPVYQRNYDWDLENCDKLFEDVLEGISSKRKHYFGNIVYYEAGRDPFSGFTRYILIDGQQRITSVMLLLAAVRDEEENESNRSSLTSTYLTNDKAEENFRVKLKQVETDRSVYEAIVEGRLESINKASTIYRNYNKFRNLVKNAKSERGYTSAELLEGINFLDIIAIDLESEKDGSESPQVIFESINATGKPLSTADLLRNFLLLEVGTDKQEDYYKNYWLVIEKNVGNDNISDYIRRYLTLETNEDIKRDTEYKEFKKNYTAYFENAEEAIKQLTHFSKYYHWIKRPESVSKEYPKTSELLQDLDDLRMIPATPTIMWLLEKADTGKISFNEVNDVFDVIASWSFRARITNIINTGEIGNILTTKILELLKNKNTDDSYAEYLWFELSNYRLHDIYPSDDMFRDAFMRYDFYKNYRRYVQQKLSSAISRDQTEIVLESIEHIMPQSIKADKWPGISPGEHVEWVNTVGNLAPMNMPDNLDNSNHSFSDKVDNIKKSDWQITREIDTENGWNISTVQKRGIELAEKAVSVWRSPKERVREIELARRGANKDRAKKFFEIINALELPYIEVDEEHSSNTYIRLSSDYLNSLIPKRESNDGGWRNGQAYHYELYNDSAGTRMRINLAFNNDDVNERQTEGQQLIMDFVNKYPPKYANKVWHWFYVYGWSVNCDENEVTLADDIKRILAEEIPRFEKELSEFIESKNS